MQVKANAVDAACAFASRGGEQTGAVSSQVWYPILDATGAHNGADSAKRRGCLPEVHRIHSYRARFPRGAAALFLRTSAGMAMCSCREAVIVFDAEASGRVKFVGNDRKNLLVIQQVQDGVNVEVGLVSENGTLSWGVNGTSSAFWQDLCSK